MRPAIGAASGAPHHRRMSRPRPRFEITPDVLLRAYSIGLFPMAESREAETLFWVEPEARGVFPLDGLTVLRGLAKTTRSDAFKVVADRAFDAVMAACARREPSRKTCVRVVEPARPRDRNGCSLGDHNPNGS